MLLQMPTGSIRNGPGAGATPLSDAPPQAAVPAAVPADPATLRRDLQANAANAAALLKALAHPDRLVLLCQLADGERGVSELGSLAGVAQPSLSQQLGVLRGERLVGTRRDGKRVLYRISSPAAMALLQTLCGLFHETAAAAPPRAAPRRSLRGGKRQPLETT
jgi:ArsR family transcriptional regulator